MNVRNFFRNLILAAVISRGTFSSYAETSLSARTQKLIDALNAAKYADALQVLAEAGVSKPVLAQMKAHLLEPSRTLPQKEPFLKGAFIGAFESAPPAEMKQRIALAQRTGYTQIFWEINSFDSTWPARYDRELAGLPPLPVAVLNVGLNDTNFITYLKWFDRYADRLHSVVLNADNLDNYDFKSASQQQGANRVLNALYRLVKARRPSTFVWVRVVWADDQSDVHWLKALTFEPDGLVLWNLPSFQSPLAAARQRYQPLMSENAPFLIGRFYGFFPLLTTATNLVEIGRALEANLPAFAQNEEQAGYRGLALDALVFKAIAEAQANPAKDTAVHSLIPGKRPDWTTWLRRDTVDAYEARGKTNAAWDKLAEQALELYVRARTDKGSGTELTYATLGGCLQSAKTAGCDDALIQYLYTRYTLRPGDVTPAFVQASMLAADALEASVYSDARKFLACWNTARAISAAAPSQTNLPPQAQPYLAKARDHLLRVINDETIASDEVRALCEQWTEPGQGEFPAYQVIESGLSKHWYDAAWAWWLRGKVFIDSAWEARGSGPAKDVTEDGWARFTQRLAIAQEALEKAWDLDSSMKEAAEYMITVELGQGKGRPRMETWFERAMQLDPQDHAACVRKLSYLEPKWHGSPEAMIEFGRECVTNKQWGGQVPLTLFEAHLRLSKYLPASEQANYWKQAEVWNDLKSSFNRFLELNPGAQEWRRPYFYYAYLGEHWEDGLAQIKLMGDQVDHTYFGGLAEYEKMVQTVKEHASH
jgi:hypothetical protein